MIKNKASKKVSYAEIQSDLLIPRRTLKSFTSKADFKNCFGLPISLGTDDETRMALDNAFDRVGGFDTIANSLQAHASDMGQYPITSFVGYGALQQISQTGMIRACIQTVADDMTRKWITLSGGENVSKLEDLMNKYHLKKLFHDAFATVGYMGGALIFIDTGAENLALPLAINDHSAELNQDSVLKFVLIDPVNVSPAEYNATNPLKSDYMKPKYWYVLGRRVHASRLLSLYNNEPPMLLKPNYNFLGIPQAQILWDYVLHWNDCRVYTANLLRKISLLVVKTDTDAVLADPQGVANLDAKMDLLGRYRDNDSVFVCDKDGEDVSNIQTSIAGCTDVVKQSLEMICAINRTPAVKTLGISPSGFNATGESDLKNYYDHIHSQQELHRDAILKCLQAIQLVEFGAIDPSINFSFEPLDVENKASLATTLNTKVNTLGQLLDHNVISADEMRQAIRQDKDSDLTFLDEELPQDLEGVASQEFAQSIDNMLQGLAQSEKQETAQEPKQG